MPCYKFSLFKDGALVCVVEQDLPEDLDALDVARGLCRGHAVEVHADARLVGRVKKDGEPLNARDIQAG